MGFYPQNVAGNKGTQLSAFILAVGFLRSDFGKLIDGKF